MKKRSNEEKISKRWNKITWKMFMDTLTILSFILTVGGIVLAIHVYFRDVRPVIEDAELYARIETLKESEEQLNSEIKIREQKVASLDGELQETTDKAVLLEREIINVYKAFYLETVYLELENESIAAALRQDETKVNVKSRALQLLKEKEEDVSGGYKKEGLDGAVDFVTKNIATNSEIYDLLTYEFIDAINELQKTIEEIESSIKNASEAIQLRN